MWWPSQKSCSLSGQQKCHTRSWRMPTRGKKNIETPGFEQPAGRADCVGSGGRVDGSEPAPHPGPSCPLTWRKALHLFARGHRGRKANAIPEATRTRVVQLYAGANHTHLSELLSEREGRQDRFGASWSTPGWHAEGVVTGYSAAHDSGGHKAPDGRQSSPVVGTGDLLSHCYWPWTMPPVRWSTPSSPTGIGAHSYLVLIPRSREQHLGVPVALYTDRHGVFKHTPGPGLDGASTQFPGHGRARGQMITPCLRRERTRCGTCGGTLPQSEPDAVPVRLIVRRVKPTPGSQLALFAAYSYHGFITDRDGATLELEADHRRHAEIENAIRDLKSGVGLNHLPSGRFAANPEHAEGGLAGRPGDRLQPGPLDNSHRSGPSGGDHQGPQATLLLYGRTAHPLGAPPHFASSPALALGKPVQWRSRPIESSATPFLTVPPASDPSARLPNRLADPR